MKYLSILHFFFLCLLTSSAFSCTEFRLTAQDGTMLVARTQEYSVDLKSNIRTSTRERQYSTLSSSSKPGLSWKAKYGYVYLDGLNQDFAIDGVNEAGLSLGALYLPGETLYQTPPIGSDSKSLPYFYFGDWVLSNFKSVDEVKKALNNIYVFAGHLPGVSIVFPLHYSIQDASGKSIVVEFVKGRTHVYDNPLGIMTNSPTFDWQLTNLRNYNALSPYTPQPIVENGMIFAATGQGAGALGLPGDISPPSRFTKISYLIRTSIPADNAINLLTLAQHVINNVDIPLGVVRAKQANGPDALEYTQWTVFKDLTNKVLYYHSYGDLSVKAIVMNKIDFSPNAQRLKMPVETQPYIQDLAEHFNKMKG